jgi:galactokinase
MGNGRDSLVKNIVRNFADVYTGQRPGFISRACGRVELIGGHTDYNEGFIIAAAIDNSCWVAASKRDNNKICLYSEMVREKHEFELVSDLKPADGCQWANYGRGVAALLLQEGLTLKGANLYIASEVPLGAGLSSSAALEVSLAKAMIHISQPKCKIEPKRLAQICQKAENIYANSPCGIMDQTVSLMGERDHAVFLDCRDLSIKSLPFDSGDCSIMVFNSMVQHEVGGGEYGKRRQKCEEACAVINKKYPQVRALRDADEPMLNSVKDQLDSVAFSRASHVIGENDRVLAAAEALSQNDVTEFGDLMSKSHCSARDLYEISCEQTDFLAEQIWQCDGAYGARIMGGGFGGSVVALARPDVAEKIKQKVHEAYKDKFDIDCDIYLAKPWQGTEIIELSSPRTQ